MKDVVDLEKVRNALAALDRLVADHPERCNKPDSPKWADNLDTLEDVMGTPAKDRVRAYRARLREKGYKAVMVYLPWGTPKLLLELSQKTGQTFGDLIASALDCYEKKLEQVMNKNPYRIKEKENERNN